MAAIRKSGLDKGMHHVASIKLIVVVYITVSTIMLDAAEADILWVNLTLVERAGDTGAFCLDGSLPAYRLHRGFGSGTNKWVLQFESGGWCNDIESCIERKSTFKGSSNYKDKQGVFSGLLSNKDWENPDFFNWNRVKLMYCDGASFSGDVEDEVSGLYFRGKRIWDAMIADLLAKGMDKVEQALLSGCSAGGLATFLHCDNFRELLPRTAIVKCHSDGGFFLDAKDITGMHLIKSFFDGVVTLQGVVNNLPKACTISQLDPKQCFFPQYLLQYIRTPLFILNAAYDSWQVGNILAPDSADPQGHWHSCKNNPVNCTSAQLEILQEYRMEMLNALKTRKKLKSRGMFISSCFTHCQSEFQFTWFAPNSPMINNKHIIWHRNIQLGRSYRSCCKLYSVPNVHDYGDRSVKEKLGGIV
ncbi:hypothetical protein KI387_005321, partial [Taxus chinensis]